MQADRLTPRAQESGEAAGLAFDRVGARAWALAIWIVTEEQQASLILVAAFAQQREPARRCTDDAWLLYDVRCRALAASAPGPTGGRATAGVAPSNVRAAILGLPEPKREIVELAVLGRLEAATIAVLLDLPPSHVVSHIADAMWTLRPLLRRADARSDPAVAPQPAR